MKEKYCLRKIRKESGERIFIIIAIKSGLPLYYENIYLEFLRTVKNKENNTIIRYAYALIKFRDYTDSENIDLVERMQSKMLLSYSELYSLTCFIKNRKFRKIESINKKQISENDNVCFRLSVIEKYLSWVYLSFYSNSYLETKNLKESLSQNIQYFKPKQSKKGYVGKIDNFKALDDEAVEELLHITNSENTHNPFNENNRLRNELIIKILHETGMRGGELLSLKVSDFYHEKRYLDIVKRYNAPEDTRIIPQCVKTEEREIPISTALTNLIYKYINLIRPVYTMEKDNEYMFITHKTGPHQGAPISYSAYYKLTSKIKSTAVNNRSLSNFTMHALRHTWNHNYNKKFEEADSINKYIELEKIRYVRMGWKINSSTSLIYNQRYIYNKATEAFRELDEENDNLTKGESYDLSELKAALGIKSKR